MFKGRVIRALIVMIVFEKCVEMSLMYVPF